MQSEPLDARGWFLLGARRHASNDVPGAVAAFSSSLDREPGNLETHLALVAVLRAAGDFRGALAASTRALERFAEHPRLLYATAVILEDLGQADAALAHYDRALRVAPDLEDALHNKGLLLARFAMLDEAEATQRRYVATYPKAFRAHSALVDVLLALGRFPETMQALDDLERLAPGDLSARIRRGVALASLRRYAEARKVFGDAQALDPQAVAQYVQRIAPGSAPDFMLSPENLFFWQSFLAQGRCDWSSWDTSAAELRRLPGTPSLLRAAGMPELVVPDPSAFVRAAVELAQPAAIGQVKAKLALNRRSAPLFDTAMRVDELGRAFEGMFERAMRGEAPRGFDL